MDIGSFLLFIKALNKLAKIIAAFSNVGYAIIGFETIAICLEKWYTYFPKEDGNQGRTLKKRNSKEEIENIVFQYYKKIDGDEIRNKEKKHIKNMQK